MRILSIDTDKPIHSIDYLNVAQGTRRVVTETLEVLSARVDVLPAPVEALILASDLQGRETDSSPETGGRRLLGEVVAEDLAILSDLGELPPRDRMGVILCGDLFARPELDRRGGSGDCRPVWLAFRDGYRWVCGVAGNHDLFGEKPSLPDFTAFASEPGIHFLDGQTVCLDGLRIGGVSGVVGNPRRPFRRGEADYLETVNRLLRDPLDLLLLHDGPDHPEPGFKGWPGVRGLLENSRPLLTVRGHAHWPRPLVQQHNGGQVLNADAQVIVLTAV